MSMHPAETFLKQRFTPMSDIMEYHNVKVDPGNLTCQGDCRVEGSGVCLSVHVCACAVHAIAIWRHVLSRQEDGVAAPSRQEAG